MNINEFKTERSIRLLVRAHGGCLLRFTKDVANNEMPVSQADADPGCPNLTEYLLPILLRR